ncbi:MAG TPA: ABC transporter ATP-binding protein [Aestuariivirgaceae bacterium]|nr:ABC transporter ATP-binding protein [Aestuariivirgaceae bacterium]
MTGELLSVSNLSVAYRQGRGWLRVVDNVSFTIGRGEVLGLVGESGCGKSTVALQLLGFRHPVMRVESGEVRFRDCNLVALQRRELDRLRGRSISYVPQNPTTALNPGIRVGSQISEVLAAHDREPSLDGGNPVMKLLSLVGLPNSPEFQRRYPHQLSGGQQQRVCIAMALACDPDLVVLDEPTTGLDVTTQQQIIGLLIGLRERLGMSMLYVTHDLGLLAQIADRVGVMYAGRMVEMAPTDDLFSRPCHPYTRGLIGSIPGLEENHRTATRPLRGFLQRETLPAGCPFSPRCDYSQESCTEIPQQLERAENSLVACWRWKDIDILPAEKKLSTATEPLSKGNLLTLDRVSIRYGKGRRAFTAARDVSFTIGEGETFALVGESGSGKSTIARAISGLVPPVEGTVSLQRTPLPRALKERSREQRRVIQFIFQNPDASLNPRAKIRSILARPLKFFFGMAGREAARSVKEALADVRLDAGYAERFGDQLSGGERQRVAIARALVAKPSLLLCDEILSALDVSVQASVLGLLQRLKREHRIAMLMISHDLAVVKMIADRVCVLFRGEIMEMGTRQEIFAAPFHPYTYMLLQAVPHLQRRKRWQAVKRLSEVSNTSSGCVFAGRCQWQLGSVCEMERPPWRQGAGNHLIRCHHTLEKLVELAAPETETEIIIGERAAR